MPTVSILGCSYYQPLGKHVVRQTFDTKQHYPIPWCYISYLFIFVPELHKYKTTQVGSLPHTMGKNAHWLGQNAHHGRFSPSAT